jgi:hypothetical protein
MSNSGSQTTDSSDSCVKNELNKSLINASSISDNANDTLSLNAPKMDATIASCVIASSSGKNKKSPFKSKSSAVTSPPPLLTSSLSSNSLSAEENLTTIAADKAMSDIDESTFNKQMNSSSSSNSSSQHIYSLKSDNAFYLNSHKELFSQPPGSLALQRQQQNLTLPLKDVTSHDLQQTSSENTAAAASSLTSKTGTGSSNSLVELTINKSPSYNVAKGESSIDTEPATPFDCVPAAHKTKSSLNINSSSSLFTANFTNLIIPKSFSSYLVSSSSSEDSESESPRTPLQSASSSSSATSLTNMNQSEGTADVDNNNNNRLVSSINPTAIHTSSAGTNTGASGNNKKKKKSTSTATVTTARQHHHHHHHHHHSNSILNKPNTVTTGTTTTSKVFSSTSTAAAKSLSSGQLTSLVTSAPPYSTSPHNSLPFHSTLPLHSINEFAANSASPSLKHAASNHTHSKPNLVSSASNTDESRISTSSNANSNVSKIIIGNNKKLKNSYDGEMGMQVVATSVNAVAARMDSVGSSLCEPHTNEVTLGHDFSTTGSVDNENKLTNTSKLPVSKVTFSFLIHNEISQFFFSAR